MPIIYWRQDDATQNYGDYLNQYFFDKLGGEGKDGISVERDMIFLIGSVIDRTWIQNAKARLEGDDAKIVYWNCGWRGRKFPPNILDICEVRGARGPLTRDKVGLSADTSLGDPGLLLPLLFAPQATNVGGKIIACPHFGDRRSDETILAETGAEKVVRTNIPATHAAVEQHIQEIAEASFVVCGAMHSAITAVAYGVPFCFYDGGGVDGPPKWNDLSQSLGFELGFASNYEEGRKWYDGVKEQIQIPSRVKMLESCPLVVPAGIMEKAGQLDEEDKRG